MCCPEAYHFSSLLWGAKFCKWKYLFKELPSNIVLVAHIKGWDYISRTLYSFFHRQSMLPPTPLPNKEEPVFSQINIITAWRQSWGNSREAGLCRYWPFIAQQWTSFDVICRSYLEIIMAMCFVFCSLPPPPDLFSIYVPSLKHYLNLLLELQQWRLQDVLEGKVVTLNIEHMTCDIGDALPVTRFHGLVSHQLQQWHHLIEIVDGFLQVFKSWPVFEGLGKFPTSVTCKENCHESQYPVKETINKLSSPESGWAAANQIMMSQVGWNKVDASQIKGQSTQMIPCQINQSFQVRSCSCFRGWFEVETQTFELLISLLSSIKQLWLWKVVLRQKLKTSWNTQTPLQVRKQALTCSGNLAAPCWSCQCWHPAMECHSSHWRCQWHCCTSHTASAASSAPSWSAVDGGTLLPADQTAPPHLCRWWTCAAGCQRCSGRWSTCRKPPEAAHLVPLVLPVRSI